MDEKTERLIKAVEELDGLLVEGLTDTQNENWKGELDELFEALNDIKAQSQKIDWTRIANDINGNPRYVCHFLNLIKDSDVPPPVVNKDGSTMTSEEVIYYIHGMRRTEYLYALAVKRANQIGGRKYHTKAFGGGIVFQSYSIKDTERAIRDVVENGRVRL